MYFRVNDFSGQSSHYRSIHLSYYIFHKWPLFKTLIFLNCFQLHLEKKFILFFMTKRIDKHAESKL